jgi:apolipoprotein N-acyltransferase
MFCSSPDNDFCVILTVVRRSTFVATVVSAVLFPLALPNELFPMGNPFLGLIALSPLYLALLWAESPRHATLVGVLFGGISTFLANYWLMFFGEYSVWTIGGATLGYMLFNAILGPFLWRALRADRAYRPLLFALVWTGYELLKSVGFLGYPWGLAAYPFNMIPVLIQIADVTGTWGLTLVVVYLSAVVAELLVDLTAIRRVSRSTGRSAAACAVLVAIVVGYGVVALNRDIPSDDNLDLLLVQQNSDSWNTRDIAGPLETAQNLTHEGIAAMSNNPDLIVWSETSLRFPYGEFSGWYDKNPEAEPFNEFVRELPAPFMTGSPYRTSGNQFSIHNSVLLLDSAGEIQQWYGKQQLVPFAEYVPFWESAVVQRFFREVVGIGAIWAPGPGIRLFTIDRKAGSPIEVGTPICFEDAFAYVARQFVRSGADILINLTNNSWSLTDSAQLQHLVAARFRAVETRRSLVRSTNAGFTGVIDPWGGISSGLTMFEEAYLIAEVPVYRPSTTSIYLRWGEYFPIGILVGLLMLLVWSTVRPNRRTEIKLPD